MQLYFMQNFIKMPAQSSSFSAIFSAVKKLSVEERQLLRLEWLKK